jgi:uncharacterized membrane protein YphA (DoxX/SURF4 family)/thiol-disulfide isomerase/thioredoxin
MRTLQVAFIIARILVGGIFIYTGLIHLADIEGFTRAIVAYDLLPSWSIRPFVYLLPITELLAGLSIAFGLLFRAGSLAATLMLATFTLALSISLYRGLDISCGCFSTSPGAAKISWMDLVRDLALLASSCFLFLYASITGRNRWKTIPGKYLVPALSILLVSGVMIFKMHTRNPCEKVTMETINSHKPFPSASILSKRPVQGICEVLLQAGDKKIAVYARENFLITGEMFHKKANLTAEGFELLTSRTFLELRDEMDQAVALHYAPEGDIRNTLYMFSRPDCPHCRQALITIMPILDETNTELKVLLIAQSTSKAKAEKIACLKVDLEMYLDEDFMGPEFDAAPACEEGGELVRRSMDLGTRLGIKSVPTFFTQDGLMIIGQNIEAIERLLEN